jgi:hypothetical protein
MSIHLIEAALADAASMKRKLESLLAEAKADAAGKQRPPIKKSNGRLTEAGVQQLRDMLDAGRPDSEIARTLGITQPAVIHQHQKYDYEKATAKLRVRGRPVQAREN